MTQFTVHRLDDAPEAARAGLRAAKGRLGFVPNLFGVLAESPAALGAYQALQGHLAVSAFTPAEQQFLALVVSVANGCTYCVAAHTPAAERAGLAAEVVEAVRDGGPIADKRLQALRRFAFAVVERRGRVGDAEVAAFLAAGFSRRQALDVLVAVAMKTISNYADHIADIPLDAAFQPYLWKAREAA